MLDAKISAAIDAEWLALESLRVGPVPAGLGTPDRYVTLVDGERPLLRIDVYATSSDYVCFEQAITWRGNLVIGFGNHVHAIDIASGSVTSVFLGESFAYFSQLYPTADYLLIASGEDVRRMEPDRSILWTSGTLAIDGVVVSDPGPPIIRGDGEHDPPGGWRPFELAAADGRVLKS